MAKIRRGKSRKPEAVRADFHAALDRLIAAKPRSKELKGQVASGKLKISHTNLAKEAERSAALLWRDHYADVRERLESIKSPKKSNESPPTVSAIRELRIACSKQIDDAKLLWIETVELQHKLLTLEGHIERLRDENKRLAEDAHTFRVQNAELKAQIHGTNVTKFPIQKE